MALNSKDSNYDDSPSLEMQAPSIPQVTNLCCHCRQWS